jgi:hypothetical protein
MYFKWGNLNNTYKSHYRTRIERLKNGTLAFWKQIICGLKTSIRCSKGTNKILLGDLSLIEFLVSFCNVIGLCVRSSSSNLPLVLHRENEVPKKLPFTYVV